MENAVNNPLQPLLNNRLPDTVGYGRDTQWAFAAPFLRYLHQLHRRGHVAARAHAVPQPVEMVLPVLAECQQTDAIHSPAAPVRLYLTVSIVHFHPVYNKWFRPFHFGTSCFWIAPSAVSLIENGQIIRPLRSIPITGTSSLIRGVPPPCRPSVLSLLQCTLLEVFPSHRDDRFSRSMHTPPLGSRRLYAGCRMDSRQVPSMLIPVTILDTGSDIK